jgi:hypothetical protein
VSRLRDQIRVALSAARSKGGVIDVRGIAQAAIESLTQLEKDDLALREAIRQAREVSRLKSSSIERHYPATVDLFPDLDDKYALGDDGDTMKLTEELTLDEFRTVVRIREEQLSYDRERLNYHRSVLRNAEVIWRRNPSWVFGQVCAALAGMQVAAE